MRSTEVAAPGKNRGGRPRKPNRRELLTLRVEPELRGRLVVMAREKGRTLTEQTEILLQQGLDGGAGTSAPPSAEARRFPDGTIFEIPYDSRLGDTLSLAATVLQTQFGRQATAFLLLMAFTLTKTVEVATHGSVEAAAWLSNPLAFHHVKAAIQFLLKTLEPEVDPTTPLGSFAHEFFRDGEDVGYLIASCIAHFGKTEIEEVFGSFGSNILDGLGEAELARLRTRVERLWGPAAPSDRRARTKRGELVKKPAPNPTGGQSTDG
jgi:hypothetical protein